MKYKFKKGSIIPAVLIISSTFIVVIYAILIVLATQLDFSNRDLARQRALHIAESGIDYYRWHLNENPTDYQDGTGQPGPYLKEFSDSNGQVVGYYRLEIVPPVGSSSRVTIRSTGWTVNHPNLSRTVTAVMGRRPLTAFAFLHNSNIWFGNEVTINGPIFTNGGIRLDGTNVSTVQTTKATYTCGIETGCNSPTEKPGIWGNGGPQELWEFPIPAVDFESINVDFSQMKSDAQNTGLYLAPSGRNGYHIRFLANGTFDVYTVNNAQTEKGYSFEFGCENIVQDIRAEQLVGNFSVADNSIIFAEDDIWVDGILNGTATVVAARFPVDTNNADILLLDNLVYLAKDGNHRLGLVSQNDIIIGEEVPENMEINGGLLAQKGRVIRHHYNWQSCSKGGGNQANKNSLTVYGSIISNLSSYWNYSGGPGVPASGFQQTNINYDPDLEQEPPQYFPTYGDFQLISWDEE